MWFGIVFIFWWGVFGLVPSAQGPWIPLKHTWLPHLFVPILTENNFLREKASLALPHYFTDFYCIQQQTKASVAAGYCAVNY